MKRGWAAICDRCGFEYKSYELQKEWNGLIVCKSCWEPRHPQDFVRVPAEDISVPWTRPEQEDTFAPFCTAVTIQAVPDVGVAGCMIAEWTNIDAFECTFSGSRAIAEYGIAGCAIAGNINFRLGQFSPIVLDDPYYVDDYWDPGYA